MFDLTRPMRRRTGMPLAWAMLAWAAVILPFAIGIGWTVGNIFAQPDTSHYLDLAAGRPAALPFASRQLGPLIVRALAHLFPISIHTAFLVEGCAALLVFVLVTGFLLFRSAAPRFIAPALAALYFWGMQFNGLVLPDLLYAALLCCFLLLLRRQQFLGAALMMFPLMVSRESTLLTVVCFLLAGWRRLRAREVVAALAATLAGILLVRRLTANALPNNEHISPLLYLVAKLPWNFLRNVFGMGTWANLYPTCAVPQWQIPVHIGPLHAIGSCGFFAEFPSETFAYALTTFGLLPLLVLKLRPGRTLFPAAPAAVPQRQDMLLRFTLIYGGISFFLAPMLGESLVRLYSYSWPLFLIGLPILLERAGASFSSQRAALLFLALHASIGVLVMNMYPARLLWAALALNLAGWLLLRYTLRPGVPGAVTSEATSGTRNPPPEEVVQVL